MDAVEQSSNSSEVHIDMNTNAKDIVQLIAGADTIVVSGGVFKILSIFAAALRCLTRHPIKAPIGADDYWILSAVTLFVVAQGLEVKDRSKLLLPRTVAKGIISHHRRPSGYK